MTSRSRLQSAEVVDVAFGFADLVEDRPVALRASDAEGAGDPTVQVANDAATVGPRVVDVEQEHQIGCHAGTRAVKNAASWTQTTSPQLARVAA